MVLTVFCFVVFLALAKALCFYMVFINFLFFVLLQKECVFTWVCLLSCLFYKGKQRETKENQEKQRKTKEKHKTKTEKQKTHKRKTKEKKGNNRKKQEKHITNKENRMRRAPARPARPAATTAPWGPVCVCVFFLFLCFLFFIKGFILRYWKLEKCKTCFFFPARPARPAARTAP